MSLIESALLPFAKRSQRLLPLWAAFLAVSTLTHQPDYKTDFAAYADYVTTTPFVVSHLVLSIGGAALAVIGAAGLAVLVSGGAKGRTGLRGFAAFAVGNVLATAVFGVAAFFQPAIGRAFHDGVTGAADLNSDVYGPILNLTVATGMVMMIIGIVWLAQAVRAAVDAPTWALRTMTWSLPPFVITGIAAIPVQAVFAVALAVSLAVITRRTADARSEDPVLAAR